jgi:hypothetical protein
MLSRGNGLLESLSFLAVILGTVCGGVLSYYFRGQEQVIGLILLGLALVGAVASLLIRKMPAANPHRPFPPYLYQPLFSNIRTLLRSRPLALAVIGIAFFTFLVAYMRQTVYMHGETRVPRWTELETSIIVGMVALGIGLGSPLVGFLSGGKVELGLVPIGALGMTVAMVIAAARLDHLPGLIGCIILIGFFTGFYIVPLFTLLQHRAPRASKGDAIATSNFINVTGAIAASVVFFLLDLGATHQGLAPEVTKSAPDYAGTLVKDPRYEHGRPVSVHIGLRKVRVEEGEEQHDIVVDHDTLVDLGKGLVKGDKVVESTYQIVEGGKVITLHRIRREGQEEKPVYDKRPLPKLLFLAGGGMTVFTLLLLWREMPDLFLRTRLWLWGWSRYRLEVAGLQHLPTYGPAILATNAVGLAAGLQVLSATDRTARFLFVETEDESVSGALRGSAARRGLAVLAKDDAADWGAIAKKAGRVLERREIVGLPLTSGVPEQVDELFEQLDRTHGVTVVPVYCEVGPAVKGKQPVYVILGEPVTRGTSAAAARDAIRRIAEGCKEHLRNGSLAALAAAH